MTSDLGFEDLLPERHKASDIIFCLKLINGVRANWQLPDRYI